MRHMVVALVLAAVPLASCEREQREFVAAPPPAPQEEIALSTIAPVGEPEIRVSGKGKEFEGNAYHVAEGKRLFTAMNCKGCHFNGGGGMGPALMDDRWIYGSAIENIVATIREGRPNGMPSFRGRIPEDQIWELAAYVRSVGGFVRKDVAPSRSDDLNPGPAENRMPQRQPYNGGTPPAPAARTP
jgi:cytochrome c oxidase cbb3-type subunit 3